LIVIALRGFLQEDLTSVPTDKPLSYHPKVSIIMLVWNSYEVTRDCLLSLRKLDYPAFETILVDNGSVDGSGERIAREFPEVKYIRNEQNLGFTGGNNVGMRQALKEGANYVLLLNNDTIVSPNFLAEMIRVAEADGRIGMVNPKIYYFEPSDKIWYAGGAYIRWKTFPVHFGLRQRDDGSYNETKEVSFATGCALLVRAETTRKVGLLDDTFFLNYEDVDWSARVIEAGYKAMYVPNSVIWHRDSYDTKKNAGLARRDFYNMRNAVLCARKHLPLYQLPLFVYSMTIYIGYVTLRSIVQSDFKRAVALYRGVWDGCKTKFLKDATI
jgi:GT2 family glycosyltransferase